MNTIEEHVVDELFAYEGDDAKVRICSCGEHWVSGPDECPAAE